MSLSALEVCWIRAPPKTQTVQQIKANVSQPASHCWAGGKWVGAAVDGGSPYQTPLRNTTQSGEECANHTLGPTVTLFNMLGEICAFALFAFPPAVP